MTDEDKHMDAILERLNTIERNIARVRNKSAYRDLRGMVGDIDRQITELSKEGVTCRQTRRVTTRYRELDTAIDLMMTSVEKHTTYAHLMPDA